MSFSSSQKAKLIQILSMNAIALDSHLAAYAASITAEMETEVDDLINDWVSLNGAHESIEPKDRNFGVRYDPSSWRTQIATNIGNLLFFASSDLPTSYSVSVVRT